MVIVGILAAGLWFDAKLWLNGSLFDANDFSFILPVFLVILTSLTCVSFMLFQSRWTSIICGGIIGALFIVAFGINTLNFLTAILMLLLFYHSQANVLEEIAERTKINAKHAIRRGAMPILLALFLLLSFGAYQSPAIAGFKNLKQLPPASEEFIKGIVTAVASSQLGQGASNLNQVTNQVTKEMVAQANHYLGPYFQYAPPLAAFTLFLILWGFGWLFSLLSLGIGLLLFSFVKKVGWARIEQKDIKAEVLVV